MISLNLAKRELKNNLKYWLLFILNLSIGLFGFTFILLFRNNINSALEVRSKTLLSSDFAISGRRTLSEKERKPVDELIQSKISNHTQLIEVYSMGKGGETNEQKTRLVHIKAIQAGYPLIGNIELVSNKKLATELMAEIQKKPRVLISKEVAHQFRLSLGDQLKLGEQQFTVYGILKTDTTTSMRGMSLAPKVYIGSDNLKSTGLIKFGSVAWYTDFYLLHKNNLIESIQDGLQKIIKDPAISVRTPKNSSQAIGRIINYLSDYLGLIGVVALLISSIGSSYLFQNYLFQRLNQIGIYKAVGLSARNIILSFCWVIGFFGLFSSVMALLLSRYILPAALSYVGQWILVDFDFSIASDVILSVIGVGILTNILICIPLLLQLFQNKTVELLSGQIQENKTTGFYMSYVPAAFLLWGLGVWQAHSFKVGSIFILSIFALFSVILFILPLLFKTVLKLYENRAVSWPMTLVIGVATRLMLRNRISSVLTILCLSIGVTLLVVIGQIDSSLKSQLTDTNVKRPSLFLFDIQEEQMTNLLAFTKENKIPMMQPSPMIRARLLKKNDELIERKKQEEGFTTREEDTERRFNNRGVNLTYSLKLNPAETLVEGREFTSNYKGEGPVEISLEKRYAQRIGVSIGDTITYDILGVDVQGVVVNLRTVKWTSFLPNFFITLQPGVLEDAPKTYLTAIEKVSFDRQLEIQDILVDKFSNISMVNVTEIISKVLTLFKAIAWAINIMSLCCVIVGLFVLYSILQGQLLQKEKDFALQKVLGMSGGQIFGTIFVEYILVVFLALFFGNTIGTMISFLVSYLLLDGIFVFNWPFFWVLNTTMFFMTSVVIAVSFKLKYSKRVNQLLQS